MKFVYTHKTGVCMRKLKYFIFTLIFFIFGYFLVLEETYYDEVDMSFVGNGSQLTGKLILPKIKKESYPLLIFVHGDGAMPYDAYGYYHSLWNHLAKNSIASFSWNKAGVESSSGNWQKQSMEDRAQIVLSAISMLHKNIDVDKIGLIGFSQGGWVLPLVSSKSEISDFNIVVSGAINWMEQGVFMSSQNLDNQHYSKKELNDILKENRKQTRILSTQSYEEYLQSNINKSNLLDENRFDYIKLNWRSDARENLKNIQSPTLAIFGDSDQNVNIKNSIKVYKEEFEKSNNNELTIKVFENSQHALLKNKYFKEQKPDLWFLMKLWFLGDEAFAVGYNDLIVNWILKGLKK